MRLREKGSVKKLTECAMFAALALIIFVLESLLPPIVPIPGVKLGLANTVTLAAIYILGNTEAACILLVRIILGNIFTGQAVSFVYGFFGGAACWLSTVFLKKFFNANTIWVLGVVGALFHNAAQLACAVFLLKTISVVYYGAVLAISSCITGTFTGLCAQYAVNKLVEL